MEGLVRKGIGGFYTVETPEGIYTCTARGKFRKARISPYAGDRVRILGEEDGTGALEEILPRKNFLVRPPIANIDQLFIVTSLRDPSPDPLILDKTIAAAELEQIAPVLVLTKTDLDDASSLQEIYSVAGIPCFAVSSVTGEGVDQVGALLEGRISAFTGNSGVGKSTLLNALFPDLQLKTGEISQKLGRGRHTTREVELYKLEGGGYVADTPGFSTFDIERYRMTDKEKLAFGFREFAPYLGACQFSSCSHTCEKGCAVLQAVEEGKIPRSRHESYCAMYQEVKDVKQWQQKSKRV
ncbi:MAG TPA: ribosome small subunit-dependent GTPase A [Candidatus Acutalibacter pullicola]|uniref:Small ribosomal subunit biogenesis GTPase RsgA n=1 Tax=Candidatus Acutalibacter pullicola TaxID=2838417 RepID=A0A9D2SEX0_9FIRM|nr:ribosome small subunit-dependent GTPase A [Candidatus Acutalibacter pullicola]